MRRSLLALPLLLPTASLVMYAQADLGTIRGVVTDASGAVIPHATVTATNTANGQTRTTTSNDSGAYDLPDLTPSSYRLSATSSGFNTATSTITVSVGSSNTFNAQLTAGSTTTIEVTSSDSLGGVNTENQEISQLVNPRQMTELPTLNRDPYSLTQLSGFAGTDQSDTSNRGVNLNFSGARSASVDILLDGAENTDVYAVGVGQPVPLDAVQELRVITANPGPQYGRASGGIVNVITKSGGNGFHGSAWEFNRVSDLSSNSYNNNATGAAKSPFVRNQFGYALGGPIKRDKLFFFSSTEWLRIRSDALVNAAVATPEFIAASAPATQQFFSTYGNLQRPINSTTYDLAYLQTQSVFKTEASSAAFLSAFPALTPTTPIFGISQYQRPGDSGAGAPENQYDNFNRVDWNITDRTTLSGHYSLYSYDYFPGYLTTSPYAGYDTGETQYNNNALGTLTHIFSPSVANTTRVLFSRLNNKQPLSSAPIGPTLYVNSTTVPTVGIGTVYFPGYSPTTPGNSIPFGGPQNFAEGINDTSVTKGRHTMTFGGQFLFTKDNRVFGAYEEAVQALAKNGSGYTNSLTNFLNGQVGFFEAAVYPQGEYPCVHDVNTGQYIVTPACTLNLPLGPPNFSRSNRYQDYAVYFNDSWKATPRMTLNAGLRWEVYGPQHSQRPELDANFYPGTSGSIFDQIRDGQVLTRNNAPGGQLWQTNYTQFGPRLGFAYDVFGNGKASLRGGYGISFERNFNNVTFNAIQNPPNYAVTQFTTTTTGNQTLATDNFGPLAGTGTRAFPSPSLRAIDPHIRPAYNQQYNLGVEQEVGARTTLSVVYTGERGIRNYSISPYNGAYYGGNYLGDTGNPANRLNLQYASINRRGADGDSYYNGVNVGLNSADFRHTGLTITANYTFSHATDNTSSTFTDGGSNNDNLGYLDPFNHALDHGSSDFDVRNRVVTALVWDIPFARGLHGVENRLLDGWEVSTIFTASTGNPFTQFDCSNGLNQCGRVIPNVALQHSRHGNEVDLTNSIGPNTFGYISFPAYYNADGTTSSNYTQYMNPISGSNDLPTCVGGNCSFPSAMTARNAFRGPGVWNQDFGLFKNIKVYERYTVQLRFEGYNIYNHANTYLNVNGLNDNSAYDYALTYKDGRRTTQLAAKFNF